MIDYTTKMPLTTDNDDKTYKYPFNASELLKSDVSYITDRFFEETITDAMGVEFIVNSEEVIIDNSDSDSTPDNKKNNTFVKFESNKNDEVKEYEIKEYRNVEYFLNFLFNKMGNTNDILCGYFNKIFKSIFEKRNIVFLNILYEGKVNYISPLINLCNNRGMCGCVKCILEYEPSNDFLKKKRETLLIQLKNQIEKAKEYCDCIFEEILIPLLNDNDEFKLFFFQNISLFYDLKIHNNNTQSSPLSCYIFMSNICRVFKNGLMKISGKNQDLLYTSMINKDKDFYKYCEDNGILIFNNIKTIWESILHNNFLVESHKIETLIYIIEFIENMLYIIDIVFTDDNNKQSIDGNSQHNKIKKKKNYVNYFISNKNIFSLTNVFIKHPFNNMFHISYINLLQSLLSMEQSLIKSDKEYENDNFIYLLFSNESFGESVISKFIDYFIKTYPNFPTLLAPITKSLHLILKMNPVINYPELQILVNKIMDFFDTPLKDNDNKIPIRTLSLKEMIINEIKLYYNDKLINSEENISEDIDDNFNDAIIGIDGDENSQDSIENIISDSNKYITVTRNEGKEINNNKDNLLTCKCNNHNDESDKYLDNNYWNIIPEKINQEELDELLNDI